LTLPGRTIKAALFLGLGLICSAWLFAGCYFTARMAELQSRAASINERYMRGQALLMTARSQVLEGSFYVRDALLDADQGTADEYREKLEKAYRAADRALQQYVPVVDVSTQQEGIERLHAEINGFRNTAANVLATDSTRCPIEARTVLRSQIMPRREGVIRVADEVQALNRRAFVQQQNEIASIYRATQWRLWGSFGLAVFVSLGIALLATIYGGRLEDEIRRQRLKEGETARDLQRLSSKLTIAQDEERRIIARELHDEVGQALTAIKVELAVAQRTVEAAGCPGHVLEDARSITDSALHAVRDLSHVVHPALLDDLGLAAAVDLYLRGFGKRYGVRVDLLKDRMDERLGSETEAAAYRIVQEALTNIAKHSHASSCRVYLQRLTNTLLVTVEDDGVGFDGSQADRANLTSGLGLIGIRERVSGVGGTLRVESTRGKGTRITVELPADVEAKPEAATDGEPLQAVGSAAIRESSVGKLRILLGDDHTLVRQGVRKILESQADWQVIAEAGDGREAVRQALSLQPDVAVLNIGMPLLNGIEATRQIVRRLPNVRVLILSLHSDEAYITRALQAGAKGYLLKDSADTDLIRGVAAVAAGKSFFSPDVAKMMLDDSIRRLAEKGIVDRYQSLSEREREIFQLIAEGHTNKEIADLLAVSLTTVETHRAHILQKLDLHSAAELVLYAVRHGIIS
jgi:signal transduction histidine kinase/DNA-binding NarL/FixJ family response regulator